MHGFLRKMNGKLNPSGPITYTLPLEQHGDVDMNALIGRHLTLEYSENMACVHCDAPIIKSVKQGYCQTCADTLAKCDVCRIKPELCHYREGTCREPQWGEAECLTPHTVYLSYTSDYKVGITRNTHIPGRWIDQGALIASPLFHVSERLLSGLVEDAVRQFVSDRTNWRTMLLSDDAPTFDEFIAQGMRLRDNVEDTIAALRARYGQDAIVLADIVPVSLQYPMGGRPFSKINKTHNFDKVRTLSGVFHGIKGQYLFVGDTVVNLRKYGGYQCRLVVKDV
jgi:hypothetical protein